MEDSAFSRILENLKGKEDKIISAAPGRADFLNTHQDYKGLPVVPIAVNLRTYMTVLDEEDKFIVNSLTLKREKSKHTDEFERNNPPLLGESKWFGNYLRAVVKALNKFKGIEFNKGLRIIIDSDIPIGSGLASSAALEVSFLTLLNYYFNIGLSKEEIAELAFLSENQVMKIPCGRLDQYSSAIGGAILIYPNPPVKIEKLPLENLHFVIVDSGIRHSVSEIHPVRQKEIDNGLKELLNLNIPSSLKEKLGQHYYDTKWQGIKLDEINNYLSRIDKVSAKRIIFTLKMQECTEIALKIIYNRKLSSEELGKIDAEEHDDKIVLIGKVMNKQHELLRDYYDVSLPEIEMIRSSMLKAGALGVKISGAGMGGSLIALVRDKDSSKRVIDAALKSGAANGWYVEISEGAKIINP